MKVIILLILAATIFANDKPYFVEASFCDPEIKLTNIEYDSMFFDTSLDITYFDSNFICTSQTCFWTYDSIVDTLVDTTYLNQKFIWEGCYSFSVFDTENDSLEIIPLIYQNKYCPDLYTNLTIDSVWGDRFTRPGYNKNLFFKFGYLGDDCSRASFAIIAKQIIDTSITGDTVIAIRFDLPNDINSSIEYQNQKRYMSNLILYPNPFVENTTIKLSNANKGYAIFIYNPSGRLVKRFADITGDKIIWNPEGLPSGLYLLKAKMGDQIYTRRLVLQR